jgi:hypothetical protein
VPDLFVSSAALVFVICFACFCREQVRISGV